MFTLVSDYKLPSSEYTERRLNLLGKIEEGTAVLLFAGRAPMASLDEAYPFLPNRNFFYFCGIEQEESVLLLIKDSSLTRSNPASNGLSARLYIHPREPEKEK